MDDIQIFKNPLFGEVRVVVTNNAEKFAEKMK